MCVCVVQALIEMAQVLSKEHHSLEVMLSKMAATIMPFTHAQYCTIFIPSEQTSDIEEKVHYLDILLNFLVFHYFVCSEYSTIFLAIHNVFIFLFCFVFHFCLLITDFILKSYTFGMWGARINLPDLQKVLSGDFASPCCWFTFKTNMGYLGGFVIWKYNFSGSMTSGI